MQHSLAAVQGGVYEPVLPSSVENLCLFCFANVTFFFIMSEVLPCISEILTGLFDLFQFDVFVMACVNETVYGLLFD